tara:strand:+ start:951 stop:1382 length:432 start_codon:yes stop_codon:yes gene_type:complete
MSSQQKTVDVLSTSSLPEKWSLTKRGDQLWMSLTIARTVDKSIAGIIETNDIQQVKGALSSSHENVFIKSMQVVVPSELGITVAEVIDIIEASSEGSVVFHHLRTIFGVIQIDSKVGLAPDQLANCKYSSLYESSSSLNRNAG